MNGNITCGQFKSSADVQNYVTTHRAELKKQYGENLSDTQLFQKVEAECASQTAPAKPKAPPAKPTPPKGYVEPKPVKEASKADAAGFLILPESTQKTHLGTSNDYPAAKLHRLTKYTPDQLEAIDKAGKHPQPFVPKKDTNYECWDNGFGVQYSFDGDMATSLGDFQRWKDSFLPGTCDRMTDVVAAEEAAKKADAAATTK